MIFIPHFIENRSSLGRKTPPCLVYILDTDGSFIVECSCVKILKRQSKLPMNSNTLKQNQMKLNSFLGTCRILMNIIYQSAKGIVSPCFDRVCLPDLQALFMAAQGVFRRNSSTIFRVPNTDLCPYIIVIGG